MKEEIQALIKGEVLDDKETLTKYSRDASIFEIRPKLVVFPKDSEDVKKLVKWVSKEASSRSDLKTRQGPTFSQPPISITARSAGTDMSGGALGESIIMDFTRHMNKLISFNAAPPRSDLKTRQGPTFSRPSTITVQPGMFYRDFEKIVSAKGLMLPSYPASKNICAIGGMVANNSGGEKTLRYGKTEKYVVGLKIVLADGEEYDLSADIPKYSRAVRDLLEKNRDLIEKARPKVSKNSAGYALWNVWESHSQTLNWERLFVGAQGTLGLITEITLKLASIKKHSRLAVIFLKDLKNLGEVINKILALEPESLESYDDHTLQVAAKYFYEFFKKRGILGSFKFIFSFLPEFWMAATGGMPKMIMLAEFAEDDLNAVRRKLQALAGELENLGLKHKIARTQAGTQKYWDIRHESFNLLRKHAAGRRTAPFIDDFIVRPEKLPRFLPELEAILKKYERYMVYTIAGHPGDGNFHIIPLMDFKSPDTKRVILELSEKVYDLVLRYGGSITAEHNDGIIRTPYLEKMYGPEVVRLFREVKGIFDPQNIFNPGKKVPLDAPDGGLAAVRKYIIKAN